jgi:DNA (cytosine-5)-methyltransferase 1
MEHHRGTVQKGKAQTLTTMGGENNGVVVNDLRIRKLTPKECGRLMGVKDEDIDKIQLSGSAKYHIFGDSICTNVLMAIFKEML